jgi:hypothetical protein
VNQRKVGRSLHETPNATRVANTSFPTSVCSDLSKTYVAIVLINVMISWGKQSTKISGFVCSLFNEAITNSAY